MKPQRISRQLLIAGTLPAAVVAFILVSWMVGLRIVDLRLHQENLGRAVVSQLAPAAEYGVFSRNTAVLQRLSEVALNQADLRSVTIRDQSGRLLARAANPRIVELDRWDWSTRLANRLAGPDASRVFRAEVKQLDVGLGELVLLPDDEIPSLGSVEIEVPLAPELAQQLRAVVAGIAILLLGVIISVFHAQRLGRRIAGPIEQLADAMARVQRGEAGVRVPETSNNELGMLESGMNRMADEVSKTQQSLEEQIAQATREIRETVEALEISNVELDLARKRALESSHLKSEFLAAMSHDIRTPMSGIIGFTHLLSRTKLAPEQREHVLTIEQSAVSLMRIINSILDLSRIEAGKLTLAREPFDIRSCVDDVLNLVAPLAYEKRLVINRCVRDDVPWVLVGDQTRVQEIITNLVSNAIKFTDEGTIAVQVTVSGQATSRGITLEISVADTGRGMDEPTQRQLFQAFGLSAPSTAKYPGTGLGLVICNRLVEAMGGDIRLESTPGKGSTFAVTLMFETTEESSSHQVMSGTVCVLEPEPLTKSHLVQLLARLGYEVQFDNPMECDACIVNGDDSASLEAASDHHRLLVLLDELGREHSDGVVYLPRVAGMAALQRALERQDVGESAQHGTDLEDTSVLVVDDSRINRTLVAHQLENLGAEVLQAASGTTALAIDTTKIAVALVDLQMPGMSGMELASTLSRHPNRRPVLVAITADATAELDIDTFQAGIATLLVKPISTDTLYHTICDLLNRRRAVGRQLSLLTAEIRTMVAEDLPPLAYALLGAYATRNTATFHSVLHDIKGIAGACKLGGLGAAADETSPDTVRGMMGLYMELALIRAETWPEWKDGTY